MNTLNAKWIAHLHTLIVVGSFASVLYLGRILHWPQITSNADFKYPLEWFPSISAAIGDKVPERLVFQYGMALSATPRFLLICLVCYYYMGEMNNRLATVTKLVSHSNRVFGSLCIKKSLTRCLPCIALVRTLSAGLWIFVTSTDHMHTHVTGMGVYILSSLLFYIVIIVVHDWWTKDDDRLMRRSYFWKRFLAGLFVSQIALALVFLYRHKALKIPGAYSWYGLFEWSLILADVGFDASFAFELSHLKLSIGYHDFPKEHTF